MSREKDLEEFFLKNPEEEAHIREIARKLKCSPTTATKYLETLQKKGLLNKKTELGHTLYKANRESWQYKNAKLKHNLDQIRKAKIIEELEDYYNNPESIILFGSYSTAEDSEKSDIDIAVITAKKTQPNLTKHEEIIGRQIQLINTTTEELTKNKHLANKIVNGIVLTGYWELLR